MKTTTDRPARTTTCARCGQRRTMRKDRPAQTLCRDCLYVEPRWGR